MALAWADGTSRRASGWAGENVARSWDHPSHPLWSGSSLRPCLGQGASRRARVGRVRCLAVLSILRECSPVGPHMRTITL